MAKESSFDVVSKVEMQEVKNAINQATKEVSQRYDFRGSKTSLELKEDDKKIHISTEDDFKLKSVIDILQNKFIKRSISIKAMSYGTVTSALGGTVKQDITIQDGISTEKAKEIVKIIKETKLKVQAIIQDNQVRVSGKNKDDLQAVMNHLKEKDMDINMQFVNYR